MTTLVLLPGMDGSGTLNAAFVAAMQLKSPPLVVTYPADRPWGCRELEIYVRERVPTDRPYVLLAESFSGPIAIALASSNPAGLAALLLVCTFVRFPVSLPKRIAKLGLMVPVCPRFTAIGARIVLGQFSTPETRTQIQQAVSNLGTAAWRGRLQSVIDVDVAAQLRQVKVPVLCVRASRDRVVSRSASADIARLCPNARMAEIDGPHFLLLCKPAQCAEAVHKFAGEHSLSL